MLRRKTPNGTLAAGYDGRPMESEARLRAAKHKSLPAADGVGGLNQRAGDHAGGWHSESTSGRPLPTRLFMGQGLHERSDKLPLPLYAPIKHWTQDKGKEAFPERMPGHYHRPLATGVDSVLDQSQNCPIGTIYGAGHDVPTVLQPMWPPCLRSGSIDDPGRYGPYWPDGAFEPYRPAPLKDPRYFDSRLDGGHRQRSYDGNISQGINPSGFSDAKWNALNLPGSHWKGHTAGQSDLIPPRSYVDRTRYPEEKAPVKTYSNFKDHGPRIGNANTTGDTTSFLARQRELVQFKEKALLWAHRIYVNLLGSIQQSQRHSSLGYTQVERRSCFSLYPKPPRQSLMHPAMSAYRVSGDEQVHLSPETKAPSVPNTRPANPASSLTDEFGLPYRSFQQLPVRKQQHPVEHFSAGLQHPQNTAAEDAQAKPPCLENSPAIAALTALELLSRLCHESGWQWTDGMLLGGCLAYGLGDYVRAMKWYSKVLDCDPRHVDPSLLSYALILAQ